MPSNFNWLMIRPRMPGGRFIGHWPPPLPLMPGLEDKMTGSLKGSRFPENLGVLDEGGSIRMTFACPSGLTPGRGPEDGAEPVPAQSTAPSASNHAVRSTLNLRVLNARNRRFSLMKFPPRSALDKIHRCSCISPVILPPLILSANKALITDEW